MTSKNFSLLNSEEQSTFRNGAEAMNYIMQEWNSGHPQARSKLKQIYLYQSSLGDIAINVNIDSAEDIWEKKFRKYQEWFSNFILTKNYFDEKEILNYFNWANFYIAMFNQYKAVNQSQVPFQTSDDAIIHSMTSVWRKQGEMGVEEELYSLKTLVSGFRVDLQELQKEHFLQQTSGMTDILELWVFDAEKFAKIDALCLRAPLILVEMFMFSILSNSFPQWIFFDFIEVIYSFFISNQKLDQCAKKNNYNMYDLIVKEFDNDELKDVRGLIQHVISELTTLDQDYEIKYKHQWNAVIEYYNKEIARQQKAYLNKYPTKQQYIDLIQDSYEDIVDEDIVDEIDESRNQKMTPAFQLLDHWKLISESLEKGKKSTLTAKKYWDLLSYTTKLQGFTIYSQRFTEEWKKQPSVLRNLTVHGEIWWVLLEKQIQMYPQLQKMLKKLKTIRNDEPTLLMMVEIFTKVVYLSYEDRKRLLSIQFESYKTNQSLLKPGTPFLGAENSNELLWNQTGDMKMIEAFLQHEYEMCVIGSYIETGRTQEKTIDDMISYLNNNLKSEDPTKRDKRSARFKYDVNRLKNSSK
jgi:hypothetical protein